MLQIKLLPEGIMIAIILLLIPFSPDFVVSILLYSLATISACTVVDFLVASYIWQLPDTTMIHQNRSRYKIYRYKKLSTVLDDKIIVAKADVKDTAVPKKESIPIEPFSDEKTLKEKEIAKFTLDTTKQSC